ncbi:MAG: CaiB/BaiF CoA-transferase family protein [Tetrasphaera sp.]
MTDTPVIAAEGPLHGITVVELAGHAPISMAGMLLVSLGAEVIRLDRPGNPADRSDNLLRSGRRSVVLDLKSPGGLAAAQRIIDDADVLIEGYRPGVLERLGLGPQEMLARNPRLVYGRLTGWGQDGPLRLAAGHDITYLAVTGALYPMGPADQPPTPPLNYGADLGGGTMFLLVGILAALQERERSNAGQVVDAAMVDGVSWMASTLLRERARGNWSDQRGTNMIDGGAPFYRCYRSADGGFLAVGAIEPEFYAQALQALDLDPAELPPQWDKTRWPELTAIFAERIATRSRNDWAERLAGGDSCMSPVLTFDEARNHPQIVARAAYLELDGHLAPGVAPRLDRTPLAAPAAVPDGGRHTADVLRDVGYTDADIESLIASGAARVAPDGGKHD